MKTLIAANEDRFYDHKKVKITHLNKIFWHKEGYTKGDLIHYYEAIADFILPFLIDKPLSLNRHPDGADEPGFFQKDVEIKYLPDWAKTTQILSESSKRVTNYLLCNDKASLIYMANLGCIEINPWLSTYKKPDYPEYLVIDLDPDGNPFKEVIKVALLVKSVFEELNIQSFVKTSGSTGIHIYVYLAQEYEYKWVRKFAQEVAQKVHEKCIHLTSLKRNPDQRKNLIYIDYLQNSKGQTIAAPYSVRPKPGASVSMPLAWDDLKENLKISDFNLLTVPKILQQREDQWRDLRKTKNKLS